jgi:hypothetical protein
MVTLIITDIFDIHPSDVVKMEEMINRVIQIDHLLVITNYLES